MSDPALGIDWPAARRLFPGLPHPPTPPGSAAEVRGVLEEARRRMHTDPEFHARVTQATRVALATTRPRDPDDARRWIELGAALTVVLDLREPIHDDPDPRRPIA